MNRLRPTLEALRAGALKPDPERLGNFLARRVSRPLAIYVTYVAVRVGFSAHAMTLAAWLVAVTASVALGMGQAWSFALGAALLQLWYLLDHVDGQLARWNRTASLDGVQLDYLMHHTVSLLVPIGVGAGLFVRGAEPLWLLAGLVWGAGLLALGLLPDSRYKALFQRLKLVYGELRLVGGGGGRPLPASRPGSGAVRTLSWLVHKSLEIHVTMNVLGLAAVVTLISPSLGWTALRTAAACYAIAALGAAARGVARSIARGEAEAQFKSWFTPPEGAALEFDQGWWYVRPLATRQSDPEAPAPRCLRDAGPPSPSPRPAPLESS